MLPSPSPLAAHWSLDPGVVFLNHGSFGATPRVVREAEARWRDRFEAEPVRFVIDEMEPALAAARRELSPLLGASAEDWAFVTNATTAVNSVARSLRLSPGDEVITSDHEYNACNNAMQWACDRAGAKLVRVRWPFPLRGEDELAESILGAITARTRLVMLSGATSPTGFITPFERIVPLARARGVDVLLDAAHGPGFMPLELDRLGAAYATGNFHKWMCAPKGSAFLHVRRDRQAGIDPAVISHGLNSTRTDVSRFRLQFDYWGTEDPARYLATPDAMRAVPGFFGISETDPRAEWRAVMQRNNALARRGRDILCAALETAPPVPDHMLGAMAAVMLPAHPRELAARLRARPTRYADALQDALIARHRVQVPIWGDPDDPTRRWVRISAQGYNTEEQYAYLARALVEELERERRG
jgi:isopenicillin-N epimerase